MAEWTPDEVDEWFCGDMDEAREHMAYEREAAEVEDEEHDREPSAEQEKAWDEQYDGTSLGA